MKRAVAEGMMAILNLGPGDATPWGPARQVVSKHMSEDEIVSFRRLQLGGGGDETDEPDEPDSTDETDSEPEPVTHSINPWTFGMDNAKPLAVQVGDYIQFTWSGNHNVQQL